MRYRQQSDKRTDNRRPTPACDIGSTLNVGQQRDKHSILQLISITAVKDCLVRPKRHHRSLRWSMIENNWFRNCPTARSTFMFQFLRASLCTEASQRWNQCGSCCRSRLITVSLACAVTSVPRAAVLWWWQSDCGHRRAGNRITWFDYRSSAEWLSVGRFAVLSVH